MRPRKPSTHSVGAQPLRNRAFRQLSKHISPCRPLTHGSAADFSWLADDARMRLLDIHPLDIRLVQWLFHGVSEPVGVVSAGSLTFHHYADLAAV